MFTESSPTSAELTHLEPEAARLLAASFREKRAYIRRDSFIEHEQAKQVLQQLQDAYDDPVEGTDRPTCLALIAESAAGKTGTMREFQRRIWEATPETPGYSPIVIVESSAPGDAQGLHLEIARQLRCTYSRSLNPKQIAIHIHESLQNYKTRMLVIDEAHNIEPLDGPGRRVALDSLKKLANSGLHVILVGTVALENILMEADEQITSRFRFIRLGRFTFDQHFLAFLNTLQRRYPLPKPSNLTDEEVAEYIFRTTDGIVGEIIKLCADAAIKAIEGHKEYIDVAVIKQCGYIARPKRHK